MTSEFIIALSVPWTGSDWIRTALSHDELDDLSRHPCTHHTRHYPPDTRILTPPTRAWEGFRPYTAITRPCPSVGISIAAMFPFLHRPRYLSI